MVFVRGTDGRFVVHSSGEVKKVNALMRQHSIDRAVEHLAGRGMSVQTRARSNGDIEVVAREQPGKHPDGAAKVTAMVFDDGRVHLDVAKIRGRRCEEITTGFAEAIGGVISGDKKKDDYFMIPAGAATPSVRV